MNRTWLRLYRGALRSWPAAVRGRYGGEALEVFRAALGAERRGFARSWAATRMLLDAVRNGVAMRLETRRGASGSTARDRWEGWMGKIGQDLGFAWTTFRRRPGLTLIAFLTLAIGIGGNTLIFSVVDSVLLEPYPYEDPSRVVLLQREYQTEGGPSLNGAFSEPAFVALEQTNRAFASLAAVSTRNALAGDSNDRFQVTLMRGTASVWATLGVAPQLGRAFTQEDDQPGAAPVAVISWDLWQSRFSGDPEVLGVTIPIGNQAFSVIGVLPRDVTLFSRRTDLWVPLQIDPAGWSEDAAVNNNRGIVARLAPLEGSALISAIEQTSSGAREFNPTAFDETERLAHIPIRDSQVGDVEGTLYTLFGAVGVVLLIACANLASLLMVQAESRRSEFAVRTALGAGRGRLVQQLVTESLLLSVVGGLGGLALAWFGLDVVKGLAPSQIARLDQATLSASVLGFTALVTLVTGGLFGLAPALSALRSNLRAAMGDGGRSAGSRRAPLRVWMVAGEVALTVVLMVGAGLLVNSLIRLQQVDLGFETEDRTIAGVLLTPGTLNDEVEAAEALDRTLGAIARLPGVSGAEYAFSSPIGGQSNWFVEIENRTDEDVRFPDYNLITPGYFELMGIPLLEGRAFRDGDEVRPVPAIIISETMATRLFPDGSAVGSRLNLDMPPNRVWREIVGVVGDTRGRAIGEPPRMQMYLPPVFSAFANPGFGGALIVRTEGRAGNLASEIRGVLMSELPGAALGRTISVQDAVRGSEAERRFVTWLLLSFAGAALLLALVGIYGVVSHTVAMRTREFGLRLALGASPGELLRRVLRQGAWMAGGGAVIGLGAAMMLSDLLERLVYEVPTLDALTYVAVSALLGLVALGTSLLPALRATRVDPTTTLRDG